MERNLIPSEEMSMQRIREWMAAHPDEATNVRATNRSYIFFRITGLTIEGEPDACSIDHGRGPRIASPTCAWHFSVLLNRARVRLGNKPSIWAKLFDNQLEGLTLLYSELKQFVCFVNPVNQSRGSGHHL
jgi:hypothetical protein